MQGLSLQKLLSEDVARRRILLHPPEPPPEHLIGDPADSIYIGRTSLMRVPLFWSYKRLSNPHIAVMGMTGSGKSYFIKTFLTRASIVWNSNALILDWSGEYVPWVKASGGTVLHLGKEHSLNLLDRSGLASEDRAKQIMGALEILTDIAAYPKQMRMTEDAIVGAYLSRSNPTLHDVESRLASHLGRQKGNEDCESSLHRIRQFLKKGRDYFARKSTLSLGKLTSSGLVCIDLSTLPSEEERSLAGLTLLQFLKERMRDEGWSSKKTLKLIIVVDEAWKIAQDDRSDLVAIVREGRKYAFGLIVASQNPSDLSKTILSNAATVFVFRLQLPEAKSYVRAALHYGDAIALAMEKFGVGQAAVHMASEKSSENYGTFVLQMVDGEEPIARLRIPGGSMDVNVNRDEFRRRLFRLGCADNQVEALCQKFEKNDFSLDASAIAEALLKYGFGRPAVLVFLRELGLPNSDLAGLFSHIQARRLGAESDRLAEVVIDDE